MCLIIALFQVNPSYPLVVAANREERRSRPSTPPHLWEGEPALWAGRDELAGGTWLGVNAAGLVAAITNRRIRPRAPADPTRPSRGLLCLQALRQPNPDAALKAAQGALAEGPSNPFNLLCASASEAWVLDWRGKTLHLRPGINIVSNRGNPNDGRLGVVGRARALLAEIDLTSPSLDQLLANLGRVCADTGGSSPLCRATGDFGTVSSSLIALRADGRVAAYHHANGPPCTVPYQEVPLNQLVAAG